MSSTAPHVQVPDVLKRQKCFVHIDLEQIRLGLSTDVPLVSQQWNAIIAVNYAARKFGITRLHHNVFDAKQLCPGPGDSQPDYYPAPSRYTHKVSLDPYRKASAKIFAVFKKFCQKYQKGGLDEIFMDVTDIVNQRIMDRYGNDLSNWDRGSADMIDWRKGHPEAGVVFGMPRDGAVNGASSGVGVMDDEDEDDEREGLDGIKAEEDEYSVESDFEENEPPLEDADDIDAVHEQAQEDDFDLDLEQYLDSDFDDSFSLPHPNLQADSVKDIESVSTHSGSAAPHQPGTSSTSEREESTPPNNEKSEEELLREKEAEEERLRVEKEQLLPYYGIPEGTFEEEFWAEMQLLIAAEFSNEVRYAVREELGYTCSAGIANNRLLAKLGSGMNKPYQQTIVLPKYTPDLLHGLKLNKIRNLGGKFGKQVKEDYSIERASQLWPVPLRQLQQRYGEQAGLELWQWCRGIDHVGITKIKSKSMGSHKSFIPALDDMEEIQFWISSMSLELVSRMQEEYDETERWPRTVSLGFYGGRRAQQDQQQQGERKSSFRAPHKGSRSVPLGSRFEYGGVEGLARKMYGVVEKLIKEYEAGRGRPILPLVLLDITVSNFSGGRESAMGDITKFFSKAPAQPWQTQLLPPNDESNTHSLGQMDNRKVAAELSVDRTISLHESEDRSAKPSEATEANGRRLFFQPRATTVQKDHLSTGSIQNLHIDHDPSSEKFSPSSPASLSPRLSPSPQQQKRTKSSEATAVTTVLCEQCPSPGQQISVEEWEQHADYHFALSLLEDDRKQQQIERQQQQHANMGSAKHHASNSGGAKRSAVSSSSTLSTRGKRKKAGSSSGISVAPLSKFFKPSAE
ncbi:DNA-directed DNA polymerase eta rad30 [Dissophora ornata]|nr:DNA-directed DNA polymerase eta rad30 [Dissophora ornata]